MTRQDTFTFRVSPHEQKMIDRLAQILRRNRSDAVRFVLVEAYEAIEEQRAAEDTAVSQDTNDETD